MTTSCVRSPPCPASASSRAPTTAPCGCGSWAAVYSKCCARPSPLCTRSRCCPAANGSRASHRRPRRAPPRGRAAPSRRPFASPRDPSCRPATPPATPHLRVVLPTPPRLPRPRLRRCDPPPFPLARPSIPSAAHAELGAVWRSLMLYGARWCCMALAGVQVLGGSHSQGVAQRVRRLCAGDHPRHHRLGGGVAPKRRPHFGLRRRQRLRLEPRAEPRCLGGRRDTLQRIRGERGAARAAGGGGYAR